MVGCGRTSATSRPSTTPSPRSTRPSESRARRSSTFDQVFRKKPTGIRKMQGLHLAQLLSVNVGQPREITWRGKTVYTSVWKEETTVPEKGKSSSSGSGMVVGFVHHHDDVLSVVK